MSTILTVLAVIAASPGLLVSPAELALALQEPSTVVLFASNNPADFDAGHIPGSRLVRYDQITVDGDGLGSELPPVEQLRAVFAAVGVSDRSRVVYWITQRLSSPTITLLDARPDAEFTGGDGGMGGTHVVARHLGYDARLYDGSIIDWTRRKLPAKTGR